MPTESFNSSKYFRGYGVVVDGNMVWSAQGNMQFCTATLVRDSDYPEGDVVYWVQAIDGSDTVTKKVA